MNEFLPKNTKEEIIKSMMRHPDTAKLVKEALSSPIGSTSRGKAQKLFSIMNKLGSAHDGAGGPGMIDPRSMYQTGMPMPSAPSQAREPKNMVVINRIPKPRINYGGNSSRIIKKNDGAGGPGIHDGAGGLWGDISGGISNALSTFTKPFTDNIGSTPSYTTAQSTPAIAPQMNPTSSSYIKPENYDPGLISKGLNWLGGAASNVASTVGKTMGTAALSVPTLFHYAGQNALQGAIDAGRSLVPHDTSKSVGPGYTTMANTPGGQMIGNMWPNINIPKPSTTVAANVSNAISQGPMQGPIQQISQPTQTTTGGAPSFYSTLSGRTTSGASPFTASTAYASTPSSGGSTNSYSGGASASYSGGASGSFIDRLVATESGGNYGAIGPVISNGGQNDGYAALGKYQIMPNLHFGTIGLDPNKEEDVQKFLQTPDLQDQLFTSIIGNLSAKYGGDEAKTAAAYFGGDRAAQAYGTPAGDVIGDGNLSVNQYVNKVLGKSGGTGSFSSLQAAAKAAVDGGYSSPTTFAMEQMVDPNNPVTGGKLFSQALEDNRSRIWDSFKLDENKARVEELQKEVAILPKDMTDYISARDTYIKETDGAISDFMKKMEKMDMSNPVVAKQATSHLNYLYTLRGRQNQSYMGYLNEAVVNHQTKLNDAVTDYNSKLGLAETELTSANEMTREKYTMYSQSLTELFQAVQDAPTKALQLKALQNQVYSAAGTGATDQAAFDAKQGYFKQRDLMKGSIIDSNLLAIPGTNLVDQIGRISWGDPSIMQDNVLRAYEEGVGKFMWEPNDDKTGITPESKRKMAEEGIRNFAQVAATGMQSGNDAAVTQGLAFAMSVGDNYAKNVSQNLVSVAPQIMESVKTLAPGGSWYTFGLSKKQPPTLEQFVNTVQSNTGGNALSESIAKAVYAVYLRYMNEPGSTPEGAVTTMLNKTSSTSDRAGLTPYTPEEFSNVLGRMYVENIMMKEFGIDPQLQQMLQSNLYQ